MDKRIWISGMLAVVFLFGANSFVCAESSDDGGRHEKDMKTCWEQKRSEMYKDLGLTEAQKKALEANKKSSRDQAKALFENMRVNMDLMRQELEKSTLDMVRINKIQGDLKSVQAQLEDHRLAGILEVRKILTPDQFKKFMKKMGEHKGPFNKGKGPKGGHCMPDKEHCPAGQE